MNKKKKRKESDIVNLPIDLPVEIIPVLEELAYQWMVDVETAIRIILIQTSQDFLYKQQRLKEYMAEDEGHEDEGHEADCSPI